MLKSLLGAPRDLLLRSFDAILGGDEWRPLLEFVSPSFFDVVPMRSLLGQGRELASNAANGRARAQVRAEVADAIAARGLALRLSVGEVEAEGSVATDVATRGQRVLELYFAQIFGADSSFIDLRRGGFSEGGEATLWSPGPYYLRWDAEFLAALRTLYEGFYQGDESVFDRGLEALELSDSKDLFARHFGDDPGAVLFDRTHFVATFHDVFERCRDRGVRLHRNFLPLGIYLASLHDHLGALGGGPFDVRAAFDRATG